MSIIEPVAIYDIENGHFEVMCFRQGEKEWAEIWDTTYEDHIATPPTHDKQIAITIINAYTYGIEVGRIEGRTQVQGAIKHALNM